MGTLTADCPRLDDHCPHKLATSVYIDGIGFVQRGTRWQGYCWFCKEFWTNRLAATDPPLELAQTRIPEIPDQTEFLERWFEFHKGYRVAKLQDGTEQHMPVIGEPFKEVSPGFLPRTLDQLRRGVQNDARRPENRLRRRRLTSEEERPDEPQQSLDSALDSLLAEVEDEETPRAPQETAPHPEEAQQPEVLTPESLPDLVPAEQPMTEEASQPANRPRPLNRGEARLQRARERFARVFGTQEDIQQDDYQSPLSLLYNRAENRYHQAEERRATNTTAPPPLDGLSARERREIEEQLLWGVMRESALDGGAEDHVWSYAPRRLQPSEGARFVRSQAMREYRVRQAQGYNRLPVRPSTGAGHDRDLTSAQSSSSTPATSGPSQSGVTATSSPVLPTAAETSPAGMAMLLRHQARYEAMLAERMAEFERAQPEAGLTAFTPGQARDGVEPNIEASGENANGNGMSQIQTSIQQITSELHRLRLASEAITSARHSMHSHFQPPPERPPQTLDNQPGRPDAMSEEEMTKKLECQVCYQQLADVALLPCGHMVMCQWCADVVIPVKHSHLPIRPRMLNMQ
ncbi:hypothetical protein SNOG_13756 [Parastagonospora nodorum SN15]|uniref:RING-type domain-containing protein n=1 Tax=Phaeosphaeria nodorum (strain SN15 / ATCC MYA-4574 / FGSC 10173) TaxID=321614 RepID=Q0U3A8_PHANO|nr:hypothetical protein SNOG_13756 [Parastagonospora nodorum SN15]EAT78780.1 hypothetical protein SNOG_13756 [Parastagonospora nodorum SN15]